MTKVLITGGAGLIGSFVVRKLIELGHQPIVFDSFTQYVSPLKSNYQKYLKLRFKDIENSVIFERGTTVDREDIANVMNKYKPSKVIHLAALPIADEAEKHIEEAIKSIGIGTANLLSVIKDCGFVDRFVYISSSTVYGDFLYEPAPEDHPLNPIQRYSLVKLFGEHLTKVAGLRENIEYVIIRPSAVYGPTDVNRRVIQIFVENAISNKPIILFNKGEERLDFTYVEDAAEGIVLATFDPKAKNQTFNITNGEARSLKDIADILKLYFPDLKIEVTSKDAVYQRPKRGSLDITKARNILGFNPKYNLEKGIKKYLEFSAEHYAEDEAKKEILKSRIKL